MRILHLTLKREWFELIASGDKTEEYRERKPYWMARLFGRTYDEVHFRNGYRPDSPFMRVEYKGILVGQSYYIIKLGKVLEISHSKGGER